MRGGGGEGSGILEVGCLYILSRVQGLGFEHSGFWGASGLLRVCDAVMKLCTHAP